VCLLGPGKNGTRHNVRFSDRAITMAERYSMNWFPAPTCGLKSGTKNFSLVSA
jgi:hypothetical protein